MNLATAQAIHDSAGSDKVRNSIARFLGLGTATFIPKMGGTAELLL